MSFTIKCLDCGHNASYHPASTTCPKCNSQWREAEYDYEIIGKTLPSQLVNRSSSLWRYHELLPIREPNVSLSLGEGGTPLIRAINLGLMLGCPIYI